MTYEVLLNRRLAFQIFLREVGCVKIRAVGDSMMPTIQNGEIISIFSFKKPEEIKIGSIILFQRYSLFLIHRVVELINGYCLVKGDNETEVDAVRIKNIIGLNKDISTMNQKEMRTFTKDIKVNKRIFRFKVVNGLLETVELNEEVASVESRV